MPRGREQLVGFANADGGDLLIGVEDDSSITGVPHSVADIRTILEATSSHIFKGQILPISHATSVELDGQIVLLFSVTKGTTQIYQLPVGRCVRRRDRECVPVAFAEIQFERQEVRSRELTFVLPFKRFFQLPSGF